LPTRSTCVRNQVGDRNRLPLEYSEYTPSARRQAAHVRKSYAQTTGKDAPSSRQRRRNDSCRRGSRHRPVNGSIMQTNLLEHPAVKAWMRLQPDRVEPESIEILDSKKGAWIKLQGERAEPESIESLDGKARAWIRFLIRVCSARKYRKIPARLREREEVYIPAQGRRARRLCCNRQTVRARR
jgi:hypothetical protein